MEVKELIRAINVMQMLFESYLLLICVSQYVNSSLGLMDCIMFAKQILQTACDKGFRNVALFKVTVHLWDLQQ